MSAQSPASVDCTTLAEVAEGGTWGWTVGHVEMTTHPSGSVEMECTACGAAVARTEGPLLVEDIDALVAFADLHRECATPPEVARLLDGEPAEQSEHQTLVPDRDGTLDSVPSPAVMPSRSEPRQGWVVKLASGGDLRVWAQWHSTTLRTTGEELRFFETVSTDDHHRVATIRAGSWHWVAAVSALAEGEQVAS